MALNFDLWENPLLCASLVHKQTLTEWKLVHPIQHTSKTLMTIGISYKGSGDILQRLTDWKGGVKNILLARLSEMTNWRPKLHQLWQLYSVPLFWYSLPQICEYLKATQGLADQTQTVRHAALHSLCHSFFSRQLIQHSLLWKCHWPANTLHCLTIELNDPLVFTAETNH